MNRKVYPLFSGDVSDAPGMDAVWIESVSYLGSNRWRLIVKGLSFDLKHIERKGTQSLIHWCLERDSEDTESAVFQSTDAKASPLDADDEERTLSCRTARLLEIAKKESAIFCVACLEGLKAGSWPTRKRVTVPRILSIDGVAKRGVWLGVYRPAYSIETTHGPGYMDEPGSNGYATVFLRSRAINSAARSARIPKRLMPQLKKLQAEFEALKASLAARSSRVVRIPGKEN